VNEDPNVKLIRELKSEIVKLKTMLMGMSKSGGLDLERRVPDHCSPLPENPVVITDEQNNDDETNSDSILKKIDLNQSKIDKLTTKWKCKWQNFHSIFEVTFYVNQRVK
jgi:hypothetical protein